MERKSKTGLTLIKSLLIMSQLFISQAAIAEEGDGWLGKWVNKAIYKETPKVWTGWFKIERRGSKFVVSTNAAGTETAEIVSISDSRIEFLSNDELGSRYKLTRHGNRATGTMDQPRNHWLPHGRIEADLVQRLEPAPGWMEYGAGDCSGHDVQGSEGALPDDAKAQKGITAICWDGDKYRNADFPGEARCTYKNISSDKCSGGENTGMMYTAGKSAEFDLNGEWGYLGSGAGTIVHSGKQVQMVLTWTPSPVPGPHYQVDATQNGENLSGTWKLISTDSHYSHLMQSGYFHAEIGKDGNTIRVFDTQDDGHNWNRVVLTRTQATGNAVINEEERNNLPDSITNFPDSGIVKSVGPLVSQKSAPDKANCNCKSITLGQVKSRTYAGMDTSFLRWLGIGESPKYTYDDKVHYRVGKTSNFPDKGNIEIPVRNYLDMMCFYFTYPQELTGWVKEGDWGNCRTVVKLDYPHTRSVEGRSGTWQLYSQRGALGLESNTWNFVCVVAQEHEQIPAGKGSVTWSVDGETCDSVPFAIK